MSHFNMQTQVFTLEKFSSNMYLLISDAPICVLFSPGICFIHMLNLLLLGLYSNSCSFSLRFTFFFFFVYFCLCFKVFLPFDCPGQ